MNISEFARATGLSVSALRYYDGAQVIRPAEVDPLSGYRRYETDQVAPAQLVRDLRCLEMPIAEVRTFLASPAEVRQKMLDDHLSGVTGRLRELEALAARVRSSLNEEQEMSMTVSAPDLARAIDQVSLAAGADLERPILQVVLVEARDGSLRLVATDSWRLAIRDLVPTGNEASSFRALIAAASLVKARAALPDSGDASLSVQDKRLRILTDAGESELWVTPAEYPDYEALLGTDPEAYMVTLEREPLVRRLTSMLGGVSVRLELSPEEARLQGEAVAVSEAWSGPKMTIGLNPRFLHDAVSSAMGPDIRFEITTPLKPLMIRAATDGSYVCLLMPIRLD